eukprot:SAG11_NODE_367_length_10114_cov_16.930904_8_plen_63_part_00
MTEVPPIVIRLGDDSTYTAKYQVTGSLVLGDNHEFEITATMMPLARGIQFIIGFDMMDKYNV